MLLVFTFAQWMQVVGLPIVFAIIGVFAKKLGKRDGDDSPHVNDWAVSTSVLMMTFGKVAADCAEFQSAIERKAGGENVFWWLIGILLSIFISIEHDRFRSWKKDKNNVVLKEKKLLVGVIIPNLLSVLVFVSYQLNKLL